MAAISVEGKVQMESLNDSRNRFFHVTKQPRCENPWKEELSRVRSSDMRSQEAIDEVLAWDPCGRDSHANCTELDSRLRELKKLVDPRWRARVDSIYAGRMPYDGEVASSLKERRGSVVFISFTYSYAVLGAYISLGDFTNFVSAAYDDPDVAARSEPIRRGMLNAFQVLVAGDFDGSRIFVTTAEVRRNASLTSQWAELFIIGHEVGHLIMKDGGARPDLQAQGHVEDLLAAPHLAAEVADLNEEQFSEVRADVMSLLIVAGEYAGDQHLSHEVAAAEGAMLALLAVGLVDGDWSASVSHPSPLTRMAVLAKVATGRILARTQEPLEERERLVSAIALRLTYAAWLADVAIWPEFAHVGVGDARGVRVSMVHAATGLFVSQTEPMFATGETTDISGDL